MEDILIPIFVCVVLPISIVLIVSMRKWHSDNKRAEILIKAIESGRDVDTQRLVDSLRTNKYRPYSDKDVLFARLLRGSSCTLIGIALIIVYFTGIVHGHDDQALLLISGLICLAIGISYLIVYFVTRKSVEKEK